MHTCRHSRLVLRQLGLYPDTLLRSWKKLRHTKATLPRGRRGTLHGRGVAPQLNPSCPTFNGKCAGIRKSLVPAAGVAGGATRAALTQHFSQGRNNAADISAKEGSQVLLLGPMALLSLSKTSFLYHPRLMQPSVLVGIGPKSRLEGPQKAAAEFSHVPSATHEQA